MVLNRLFVASTFALAIVFAVGPATAGNPSALWDIVSGKCVSEQSQQVAQPTCAQVDISQGLGNGFAVLKDNATSKPFEYLLIPTTRIAGTEDPRLLEPLAPNYFEDAWEARHFIGKSLGTEPQRDMVALAINSMQDRSQDQFHIHVDCIRGDVRSKLKENDQNFGSQSTQLDLPSPDHPYAVLRLVEQNLAGSNPFQLVAQGLPGASGHMGLMTIVIVGATFPNGQEGFYVLASQASSSMSAHGEDLIDPDCRLANR
ncbi:CDP-diacylglycerol pyrophosphatase [Labrys miyagiensis]|uniref:CDP-diacylglycerol pyrophosphatase n=1 Tax=Labrys miyagiensis TaxID=346912 RepID=A0ABQ6CRZ8_9HYPH|nr:CDP-diacylglycerol diphosphatase [Labrys miyagiensis]GLS21494.1 CDP-diacylglycerol pyrophosphatase [Labrys miyagiensis]